MKKRFICSRKITFYGRHDKAILRFRKNCFFRAPLKKLFFTEISLFLSSKKKSNFIRFPKIDFSGRNEKSDLSVFRKIAFSGRHEKLIFSVYVKSLILGGMKKRFFLFPKNRF